MWPQFTCDLTIPPQGLRCRAGRQVGVVLPSFSSLGTRRSRDLRSVLGLARLDGGPRSVTGCSRRHRFGRGSLFFLHAVLPICADPLCADSLCTDPLCTVERAGTGDRRRHVSMHDL